MTNLSNLGAFPVRQIDLTANGSASALSLARRNAGFLLALLYLQDIFWLVASRVAIAFYEPMYQISRFDWLTFSIFVILTICISGLGIAFAQLMRPLSKISVSRQMVRAVIILTIGFNLLLLVLLESNARYVSGGLVGSTGIMYGLSQALSLASMVIFIRAQKQGRPFSKVWYLSFLASLALIVDGLASALTIGMFVLIILDIRIKRPGRVMVFAMLATLLVWFGLQSKFSVIPDYFTLDFMANWTIARFSIQAEQAYTYLAGESVIGNRISYLELVFRAISDRYDLITGRPLRFEYPRNVSEAAYFDMWRSFGSGSSPGALLGTLLQGPFFFIPPMVFAFLFVQYFSGIPEKVSILHLFAYSFLFKVLHTNFSEFLTIFSPTLFVGVLFLLACRISPRASSKGSRSDAKN